jgi:hypothetical protein
VGNDQPLGPGPKVYHGGHLPGYIRYSEFHGYRPRQKAAEIALEGIMEALPTDALTIAAREASVAARALAQVALWLRRLCELSMTCCHELTQAQVQTIVDGAKTRDYR